jgi:hypothetical protein
MANSVKIVNLINNKLSHRFTIPGETTTKHEINAKDYTAGDTVFTVEASDPSTPADDITYNLVSCEPAATCNFTLTPSNLITGKQLIIFILYHSFETFLLNLC